MSEDKTKRHPLDGKRNGSNDQNTLIAIDDSPESNLTFINMAIHVTMSELSTLLCAIKEWESVADNKFKELERELSAEYPKGFPYDYDPLMDNAITTHFTTLALYGSLAVAISAKVEEMLPYILESFGIDIQKKKTKINFTTLAVAISAKVEEMLPYILKSFGRNIPKKKDEKYFFNDYMFTFESAFKPKIEKRDNILHYKNHLFVQELANRFKHSGGKSTKKFLEKYKAFTKTTENQDILFDQENWELHIKKASELLYDVAKKLANRPRMQNSLGADA